ncbi:MAG: hypothetical protein ABH879_02415 [archaeon]
MLHRRVVGAIIFLGLVLAVFVAKPAVTGYSVYSDLKKSNVTVEDVSRNLESLRSQVIRRDVNLSACYHFSAEARGQLDGCLHELKAEYTQSRLLNYSLASLRMECAEKRLEMINSHLEEISELEAEAEVLRDELDARDMDYDALVRNMAGNVCCKEKIDNQDIGYYEVRNARIVCLEEGDSELSCPFG